MSNLAALTRSLFALQSEGRTGVLSVLGRRDSVRIAICLRSGDVVFATEGSIGPRLAQAGLLSQALYERIAARGLTPPSHSHQHPKSTFSELQRSFEFCRRAAELGLLTHRSIEKALEHESTISVKRAFTHAQNGDVEWIFEPIETLATLDARRLLENVRRHAAPVNVQACLQEVVSQTPPTPSMVQNMIRRPSPPPSRYATLRIPAAPSTSPPSPSAGALRTASTPQVSGFYPSTRAPAPSSPEAMILGERILQTAIEHITAGRWSLAAPELARAAQLLPNSHEVHLYQKWTAIQLRPDRLPTRSERHDLGRTASAALQKDVGFAFGYYVAGDIALNEGDIPQAHRLLSRAVKLDPNLLDAHRLLRIAERRTTARAK